MIKFEVGIGTELKKLMETFNRDKFSWAACDLLVQYFDEVPGDIDIDDLYYYWHEDEFDTFIREHEWIGFEDCIDDDGEYDKEEVIKKVRNYTQTMYVEDEDTVLYEEF